MIDFHKEGRTLASIVNSINFDKINLNSNNFYVVVGSGMSFVVAEYLSYFLMKKLKINVRAFTPLEYLDLHPEGIPIVVTYRGKNRDILCVAKSIAYSQKSECIVVTGTKDNSFCKLLLDNNVNVNCIYLPQHADERRFVSLRSTISLMCASWQWCEKLLNIPITGVDSFKIEKVFKISNSKADKFVSEILSIPNYHLKKWTVLGIGLHDPLARLIQSCFAESGLMSVEICDCRDYLHGKYLAAFEENNNLFVLIDYKGNDKIIKTINERFGSYFDLVNFNASRDDLINCLIEMLSVFLIAEKLLLEKGFSLRNPPKPKKMKDWTSWGEILG